ncbi:MAG: EthD family reductase [Bacteroidota bacterium]
MEPKTPDGDYKFHVLYPQPTDTIQFDLDYSGHLNLLDSLMGYSQEDKPYYITKFGTPAPFYQMFIMTFETREELDATINSKEMEEAGKDAMRISSGGAPIVLIGNEE